MDRHAGDGMDIKAVLTSALPLRTAASLSTVEELKERIARKRRQRRATIGVIGVATLTLLLILVLLPFSLSNDQRAAQRGQGRAHGYAPTSSPVDLTSVALAGPSTGYLPSTGPIAISPNGRVAYVGDAHAGFVTPVDLPSGRAQRPIELGQWGINAI